MNILVSIITVVKNNKEGLEKTIKSVLLQTFKHRELIVIDGGSTDGTKEIVKKYSDSISYSISEPDTGIYNAMNKGLLQSSGEWIMFLNSGDTFFESNVLENVFQFNYDNYGVIYGATNLLRFSKSKIIYPYNLSYFKKALPFCHQSVFVKRSLVIEAKFNDIYKICADYDMFLKLYNSQVKFKEVNIVISTFDAENGISSKKYVLSNRENLVINKKWNTVSGKLLFLFNITRSFFSLLYNKTIKNLLIIR